jgi:hypothetical protein
VSQVAALEKPLAKDKVAPRTSSRLKLWGRGARSEWDLNISQRSPTPRCATVAEMALQV